MDCYFLLQGKDNKRTVKIWDQNRLSCKLEISSSGSLSCALKATSHGLELRFQSVQKHEQPLNSPSASFAGSLHQHPGFLTKASYAVYLECISKFRIL